LGLLCYVDMGGWVGGQAEYVMVPYADFNLLKFPDKAQAMEKIRDLTCLSDIFPTATTAPFPPGSEPDQLCWCPALVPLAWLALHLVICLEQRW
jgi:glutathione-independent formaldehyde dehydrogenase